MSPVQRSKDGYTFITERSRGQITTGWDVMENVIPCSNPNNTSSNRMNIQSKLIRLCPLQVLSVLGLWAKPLNFQWQYIYQCIHVISGLSYNAKLAYQIEFFFLKFLGEWCWKRKPPKKSVKSKWLGGGWILVKRSCARHTHRDPRLTRAKESIGNPVKTR